MADSPRSRCGWRMGCLTGFLEIFAFPQRHENQDSYDLVSTFFNHESGPRMAGTETGSSPVAGHPRVEDALALLGERFADAGQDGPNAYASFLAALADADQRAHRSQEAVATVRAIFSVSGIRSLTSSTSAALSERFVSNNTATGRFVETRNPASRVTSARRRSVARVTSTPGR